MDDHPDRSFKPISPAPDSDEEQQQADSSAREDDPLRHNRRRILSGDLPHDQSPSTPECEEVAAINQIPEISNLRLMSPEVRRPTPMRREPSQESADGAEGEIRSPIKVACVVKSLIGEPTAFSSSSSSRREPREFERLELVSVSVGIPPAASNSPEGETCDGRCVGGMGPCPGNCMVISHRQIYASPFTVDVGDTMEVSSTSTAEFVLPTNRTQTMETTSPSCISSTSGNESQPSCSYKSDTSNRPSCSNAGGSSSQRYRNSPKIEEPSSTGSPMDTSSPSDINVGSPSSSAVGSTNPLIDDNLPRITSRSLLSADNQPSSSGIVRTLAGDSNTSNTVSRTFPRDNVLPSASGIVRAYADDYSASCSGISVRKFASENYPPSTIDNEGLSEATGGDADSTTPDVPLFQKENNPNQKKKKIPQPSPADSCRMQGTHRSKTPPGPDDDSEDKGRKGSKGKGKGKSTSARTSPR